MIIAIYVALLLCIPVALFFIGRISEKEKCVRWVNDDITPTGFNEIQNENKDKIK